jgi:hypothetical protein
MNTKSLILKKGLFSKKLMFAIPLLVSTFTLQPYRERHSIIFLEKNYFKQTNSQRVGIINRPSMGLIF